MFHACTIPIGYTVDIYNPYTDEVESHIVKLNEWGKKIAIDKDGYFWELDMFDENSSFYCPTPEDYAKVIRVYNTHDIMVWVRKK